MLKKKKKCVLIGTRVCLWFFSESVIGRLAACYWKTKINVWKNNWNQWWGLSSLTLDIMKKTVSIEMLKIKSVFAKEENILEYHVDDKHIENTKIVRRKAKKASSEIPSKRGYCFKHRSSKALSPAQPSSCNRISLCHLSETLRRNTLQRLNTPVRQDKSAWEQATTHYSNIHYIQAET